MQSIRVEVDDDGRTRIQYEGFAGDMCFKEAQKLLAGLRSLGVDVDVKEVRPTAGSQVATQERTHG